MAQSPSVKKKLPTHSSIESIDSSLQKFSCPLKFWTPMIAKIIKKNSVTNTTFAIFGTAAMIEFTTNFKPGNRRTTRNGLKPRKARNERKALRVLKSPLPSVVENGGFMIKPTIDMLTKNPSNRFRVFDFIKFY